MVAVAAAAGNTAERNTTEAPTDVAVGADVSTVVAATPEDPAFAARLAAVAAACCAAVAGWGRSGRGTAGTAPLLMARRCMSAARLEVPGTGAALGGHDCS